MNNRKDRLVDIFFYGLYMDASILAKHNIPFREPRNASVEGYRLRIGNNATLLRKKDSIAYGVVCSLTHQEVHKLYTEAGLHHYVPESIMVMLECGENIPALCYVLLDPPNAEEDNVTYYERLIKCMIERDLPIPEKTGREQE